MKTALRTGYVKKLVGLHIQFAATGSMNPPLPDAVLDLYWNNARQEAKNRATLQQEVDELTEFLTGMAILANIHRDDAEGLLDAATRSVSRVLADEGYDLPPQAVQCVAKR